MIRYTSQKQKCDVNPDIDKGQDKLMIDATVADQMIAYPTDLNLLNESRQQSERLIDTLYEQGECTSKPRTYRRNARKEYLQIAKKKRKSKRGLHKAIGKQLRYLRRNLNTLDSMLDHFEAPDNPFPYQPATSVSIGGVPPRSLSISIRSRKKCTVAKRIAAMTVLSTSINHMCDQLCGAKTKST